MSRRHVRDQIPDYVVGSLPAVERGRIERHLRTCAVCRAERSAVEDGMAAMGLALRPVEPPPKLVDRVVSRVAAVRVERPLAYRRVKALAASTLAAAVLAAGAVTWAVAERGHVGDAERTAKQQIETVQRLRKLFEELGTRPAQGRLIPAKKDGKGFGSVLVYNATRGNDLILVRAVLPSDSDAPYTLKAADRSGHVLSKGTMIKTNDGDWLFYESSSKDLSRTFTVSVADQAGETVIVGPIGAPAES